MSLDPRNPIPIGEPVSVYCVTDEVTEGVVAAVTTTALFIVNDDCYTALPFANIVRIEWDHADD